MKAGRPFPPWDRRPQLWPHLQGVWEAYWELDSCRPVSTGMGRIPWTAIRDWTGGEGGPDSYRFRRLIRRMEAAHLDHYSRQAKEGKPDG